MLFQLYRYILMILKFRLIPNIKHQKYCLLNKVRFNNTKIDLEEFDTKNIRNFSIIAHIGKNKQFYLCRSW